MRKLIRILFFGILLVAAIAFAGLGWMFSVRPGLDAYNAHRYPDTAPGPGLSAAWFGTTAVLLSDGEYSIF
ncbi:MAG: hypothetical protein ACRES4_02855, partial [Nevskiales bacterium]